MTREYPLVSAPLQRTAAPVQGLLLWTGLGWSSARVTSVDMERLPAGAREATIRALALGSHPVEDLGSGVLVESGPRSSEAIRAFSIGDILLGAGVAGAAGILLLLLFPGDWPVILPSLILAEFIVVRMGLKRYRSRTEPVRLSGAVEADVPIEDLGKDIRNLAAGIQEQLWRLWAVQGNTISPDVWLGCYQAQADIAVIHELRRIGDRAAQRRIRELLERTNEFSGILGSLVEREVVRPELAAKAGQEEVEREEIRQRLRRHLAVEPSGNYLELGAVSDAYPVYPGLPTTDLRTRPSWSPAKLVVAAMLDPLNRLVARVLGGGRYAERNR